MRFKHTTGSETYATPPDNSVSLARLFKSTTGRSGQQSTFLSLHNNEEALAWRIALIEKAELTIDAQYYSWHTDISGQLLISKLIEAANRGVRVRLLLDDIHTFGADRRIATLNYHPNIEVRLFNPFRLRWAIRLIRVLEFLWFIGRLNRRMHNKLLVADNVVAIIGGRNVGDQYFGLDKNYVFRDLDLLTCGPAVTTFSQSFDLYWNSRIAKTARRIIAYRPGRLDFRHMKRLLNKNLSLHLNAIQHIDKLKSDLFSEPALADLLTPAAAQVFYDPPMPGINETREMLRSLYQCSDKTFAQLTLISAYFIPSEDFLTSLQSLIDRGVRIQLYTNSLASIDVTAAFSGYQRYRHRLLTMGIELYEFRTGSGPISTAIDSAVNFNDSGLHAKSIIFDTSTVYVGTLNLDPRSATINTEAGVLVESEQLAIDIRQAFQLDYAEGRFWQVKHDNHGQLSWSSGTITTTSQPARGIGQRIANIIYSRLPIQQHL